MHTDSRVSSRLPAFFSQLYVRLVVIVLFVLIPALILALLTTVEQNRTAIDAARQQALVLTRLTAANQEQIVSGTEQVLIALSQIPDVRNGNTEACNALFVQLREQFESYTNFYMVDAVGDTICTGLPDAAPVNVAGREWFERAQLAEGFSVADYALGVVSGRPVLTLSYPIYDEARQKKYFLGASLNLEWMSTFISASDFPPNTTVTAIDRSGRVLYRYPDGDVWIGKQHPNDELVSSVLSGQTGTLQATGLDGVDRLYGFVPLDKNASAFILVGLSQDVVFGQSRVLLFQNLLGLAVVGFVTLAVALYGVNRFLVQPIQTLAHTTVRLAEGDLKTRVNLELMGDTQELTKLGSAFNTMAESLEQAQEGLEAKVHERTRELTILAEASSILSSSLDYEKSLKMVTGFIVPELADWCVVDLLDENGLLRRLAIAHIDPEKVKWAEDIHRLYPPDPNSSRGLYSIIQTREASLHPEITDAMLVASARDEQQLALLRELGFVSSMAVPLLLRERILGVITFVSSTPGRHYTSEDMKLAKELARRAATAIDNATLYREMQKQRKQLQVTLFSIGDAVIATDIEGKIIFINPVAQQVTGWDESEAIGMPLADVFRIVSETTGEIIESPFDKVVREGKIIGLANHTLLIARDGTRIPIDDSGAPIFDETQMLTGVILVFRDITERRKSEQRLNLLFELTTAFSLALTPSEVAEVVVEKGLKALGAVLGTVCLLVNDGTQLEIINRHGLTTEAFEKYRYTPLDFKGPLNEAVRSDTMIWIETAEDYMARYPHFADAIKRNGSRSTICIPLKVNDKMMGGFSLSFPTETPRSPGEEAFFTAFAQQCAQSLERARLYEAEQGARAFADQNLQRVTRLQAATAFMSEALTIEQVSAVIIEHTTHATNASSSVLARLIENSTMLEVMGSQAYDLDLLSTGTRISLANVSPQIAESIKKRGPVWFETASAASHPLLPKDVLQAPSIWGVLPLNSRERILGVLVLSIAPEHELDDDEKAFLVTLTQQCAQALERALLYEQAKDVAALQERQRLARDLHDAVSQVLFSSTSIAEIVPRIWERDQVKAFEQMKQVVVLNRAAMAEMRSLLLELRPEAILRTNLNQLIEQLLRAVKGRKTIETDFVIEGQEYMLPPEVHVAFYRIAQEAINNIVKHSQATRISVTLAITTDSTTLLISDNGRGFEIETLSPGIGLHNMKERAAALGIQFDLQSQTGDGTHVTVAWNQI